MAEGNCYSYRTFHSFMSPRFLTFTFCFLFLPLLGGQSWAQEAEAIEIKTLSGLRFDPPRFVVKPGAKVKLEIENADDMAHNFVLVASGARMEIVNAAMTMPITPEQTFIPPSDNILQHTPVLIPGKTATLDFTAPVTEGVYPYVCTYPGHGLVMYGAMYVSATGDAAALPPVASDENLPEMIRDQAKTSQLHAYPAEPPYWYRIFMRESGPASIAVALPGGQNYCWDAGACRLRYLWRGAFLDPMPHWRENGDAFAEVKGTIYYRPGVFPLRVGDPRKVPTEVRFRGMNIVEKFPEFHYEIGSVDVRELIKPLHHGGVEITYSVTGARNGLYYVIEPGSGVEGASTAGKFSDGVLKVSGDKTKQFLITLTEIPNKEAVGYWSMNDTLKDKKPLPVEGVKGRALVFDGKKSEFATGLKTDAIANGGSSFAVWAQLTNPPSPEQIYIGARHGETVFALGANLAGVPGFGVRVKNDKQESKITAVMPMEADGNWHHLAATVNPAKEVRFFLDGKPAGVAAPAALPANAEFFIGSSGQGNFTGATMDEAHIYARVLDAKEIAALYESEKPKVPPKYAAKPTPKPGAASSKAGSEPAATPTPKPAATASKATPTPKPTTGKATPSPKPSATPTPKPGAKATPTPKPATGKPTSKPAS